MDCSMVMNLGPKQSYNRLILKSSSKHDNKLRTMAYILRQINNRVDCI